jgi:hypothetical protein
MHKKTQALIDYRNNSAKSQSELKGVLSNNVKPFKGSIASMVGNLVDCCLTTPECLEDWFYVSNLPKYPKPQIKLVFDTYYNILVENELPIDLDVTHILEVFREVSNSNSKDSTVMDSLLAEQDYWDSLKEANGRVIVSQEYWNKCNMVAYSLKTNLITKEFFEENLFLEIEFQKPIFWTYTDKNGIQVECKGLLDIFLINHQDKTVQIVDIKTTGDSLVTWKKNIARKHNPVFQLAYYYEGINQLYPQYIQLEPVLVVENVDYPGKPRVFDLSSTDLVHGRHGCVRQKNTIITEGVDTDYEVEVIHGWEGAMEKYIQAKQLGLPDYDVEYYATQGKSLLNLWI